MDKLSFEDATPEERSLALAIIEDLEKDGVEGLRERLGKTGDDTARSLVSLESPGCISSEAIAKMFDAEELKTLENKFAGNSGQLGQRLALIVPRIVGRLTPLGKLPSERALKFQCSELKRKLAR